MDLERQSGFCNRERDSGQTPSLERMSASRRDAYADAIKCFKELGDGKNKEPSATIIPEGSMWECCVSL